MTVEKNQFEVVRTATIAAPPAKVHGLIHDFHQWPQWSPWEELDPEMQRTYSGAESGVGAVYQWSGNKKAGEGRMEITGDEPDSKVTIALDFIKPFKSSNTTTFEIANAGEGSAVTWRMVGPKTFMTKVMGIFKSMDKMVGPDFEKGLQKLSTAAEA